MLFIRFLLLFITFFSYSSAQDPDSSPPTERFAERFASVGPDARAGVLRPSVVLASSPAKANRFWSRVMRSVVHGACLKVPKGTHEQVLQSWCLMFQGTVVQSQWLFVWKAVTARSDSRIALRKSVYRNRVGLPVALTSRSSVTFRLLHAVFLLNQYRMYTYTRGHRTNH